MKKLLIFDAFGTLISTGSGSITATRKILALQDREIDPERFYADWKKYHRRHIDWCNANFFIPERGIFEMDLRALYEDYGIDRPYSEDVAIMLDSLEQRVLFPETADIISRLRREYRVVIGSTTDTEPLMVNLSRNTLEVDEVYTSEMLGHYKPSEHFYRAILRLESCTADEAVFIGDSLPDDVVGPKRVGLHTVLVDRAQRHREFSEVERPDHVVSDLSGTIDILKSY